MENPEPSDEKLLERQPNKTLVRGLMILTKIEELGKATLTTIACETGLPKPTVSRLLQTLKGEGYVRELGFRRGFVSARESVGANQPHIVPKCLVSVARTVLCELALELKFPSWLAVIKNNRIGFAIDNCDIAPITLPEALPNADLKLEDSASRIAYLAALSASDLTLALQAHVGNVSDLQKSLTVTRDRGFALKSYSRNLPGLKAIAVAVLGQEGPLGCLETWFIEDYVDDHRLQTSIYPKIKKACETISANCET